MDRMTQKPFACKAQECEMSFTNEDHLKVHERKHEMVLSLELDNKSTNAFIDQTPTPTRLIRNCEEVGLFDDLKHVNPFDETFRRAVELKQNEITIQDDTTFSIQHLDNCLMVNEETLHTPQVFPNMGTAEDFVMTEHQQLTISSDNTVSENIQIADERIQQTENLEKKKIQIISSYSKRNIAPKPIILPNMMNVVQPQIIVLELPEAAMLPSKPILLPKTEELTNILPQSQLDNMKLRNISNDHNTSPLAATTFKKTMKSNYYSRKPRESSKSNSSDDDSLVRRRAAAMRYRKKIKLELAELRVKNAKLMEENKHLDNTVKQLKLFARSHAECDVTKAALAKITSSMPKPVPASMIAVPVLKRVVSITKLSKEPKAQ